MDAKEQKEKHSAAQEGALPTQPTTGLVVFSALSVERRSAAQPTRSETPTATSTAGVSF